MNLEYDLDEVDYTDIEEMEVIKEIRLGLMMGEITKTIHKQYLIDWFARIQMPRKDWCENVTTKDLINIAEECGLKII